MSDEVDGLICYKGRTQNTDITTSFTVPPKLPFRRNHMFCGRDELIDTVRSYFKGSAPSELGNGHTVQRLGQKVVVLHGLGGVGKTSIALEYAFRYSNSYTTVFWADLTSGLSLTQSARGIAEHIIANYAKRGFSYEQIAATLGLRGVLDANGKLDSNSDETATLRVTEAVKEWLAANQNGEHQWLLILDNYDDVNAVDIRLLLPTCDAGNVIITSRKSNLQAVGKTVAVDEIDEDSGIALFLKSASKEEAKAEGKHPSKLFFRSFSLPPSSLSPSLLFHCQWSQQGRHRPAAIPNVMSPPSDVAE
jgi:hypothetical protein